MASNTESLKALPANLPVLPEEWSYVPLEEIVQPDRRISYGIVQPGSETLTGVPVIRVNNIRGNRINTSDVLRVQPEIEQKYNRTRLIGGEVLLTLVGTLGECAVVPQDLQGWNVARAVAVICPKRATDNHWIAYCLRSNLLQHFIKTWATTTVQATLNLGDVARLPIPMPPKSERERITSILCDLDDKIELNRRMNETLEAMARAIFKSWFVDFDPVRAKANGQQPSSLSAEIAALFPDSFEDSPLGDIPAGWEVKKLGDVVGFNKKTLGKNFPHDEIEYVDISSVTVGKLEGTTRHSFDSAPSRARRLVSHGDTIWSTVRPNRKSYLFIHSPIDNLVVSTGFAVMTPEEIPPAYLYSWVTTQEFVDYLTYNADGSAYPAVRVDRIADADVLLPPPPVLKKFQELVGNFLDKAAANDRESVTLAEIRDTLLPKLLSGEIRVSNLNGGGAAA